MRHDGYGGGNNFGGENLARQRTRKTTDEGGGIGLPSVREREVADMTVLSRTATSSCVA